MIRRFIALIMASVLTACSSEDKAATCHLTDVPPPTALKFSTYAHQAGISLDQEKLTQLMWTSAKESECFLRRNGNIRLGKIKGVNSSVASTQFVELKPAATEITNNWNALQTSLGVPLMGLTTFRFYEAPQEKLETVSITLNETARMWHLWHEYAHYLIGKDRVESRNDTIRIYTLEELEKEKKRVIEMNPTDEGFDAAVENIIGKYADRAKKMYIDEMLIELSLIHLTLQARDSLPIVVPDDYIQSMYVVGFFESKLSDQIELLKNDFLFVTEITAQEPLALKRLKEQQGLFRELIFEMQLVLMANELL